MAHKARWAGVIDGGRIHWADPGGYPPPSDGRLPSRRRRLVAAYIAVAAVVVQATVAVAWWNPWRYVHLMTSTHDWHPLAVLAGSVVVLGIAGWLGLRRRAAARATVFFAVAVLLAITCLGAVADLDRNISNLDRRDGPGVVAISPDGRYEIVVTYTGAFFGAGNTTVLRVRSRNGLLSRESTDLACFRGDSEPPAVRVTFTGPQDVMISAGHRLTWQTSFDPETLHPNATYGLPCQ